MRIDMRNKVLCNNGTYDITNGAVAPCVNAGGVKDSANAPAKTQSIDSKIQKITGAYNQNLIIAVVLVAGYFAYKKFKK
jgi:hypothetical protein